MTLTLTGVKSSQGSSFINKFRHFVSTFSDFILVGLLILAVFAIREISHVQRMELLQEPQINDFYFVDFHLIDNTSDRQFRYLPMKVAYVGEQCIHFFAAKNGHNEPVSINSHVKLDATMRYGFFHKDTISFSKSQVQNWADNGILYDIGRPSSYYINGWIVIGAADIIRVDDAKRKKYTQPENCL